MARPAMTAMRTASRFRTGSAPGWPEQTGQVLVLGRVPNRVGQEQKSLVSVLSCACTSIPITASYAAPDLGAFASRSPVAPVLPARGGTR